MKVTFTIAFIVHTGHEIMSLTIPQNLESICGSTRERFDVVLVADGVVNDEDRYRLLRAADRWKIDEVRFRSRLRNCASGDPSNNGHFHTLTNGTPYLITLEEDVAIFRLDPAFDMLAEFRSLFERHEKLVVATRADDHDCWNWKLEATGPDFEPGVLSVNRVASHFLAYSTGRAREALDTPSYCPEVFQDDASSWYNYEDLISRRLSAPAGPGIAFVERFPIRVFHCDRKIAAGSPFYTKELSTKLLEFRTRHREVLGVVP
jgi:hypothetical protein